MMKTKNRFAGAVGVLLALCGATLVGCGNDSSEQAPQEGRMRFQLLYPGQDAAKSVRASAAGFDASDVVGVYVTDATKPLQLGGNQVNNASMQYDGSAWQPSTPVYWSNGAQYNVYAYYPYIGDPNSVDECDFAVQTDQTTARADGTLGGYEASDFLWASRPKVAASKDPVPLTFKHRMSSIKINLVPGADYEGNLPDEQDVAVYVHNTVVDATIDFASGIVTKNPYKRERTIQARPLGGYSYAAIIVPQRLEKNLPLVEVVMKGVSYLVETRFQFKMGVRHSMNVIVSKNPEQVKIELGGEIVDWEKTDQ